LIFSFPGDLKKEEYCKEIVEKAFKEFGKVDILVNNAADSSYHKKIEEVPNLITMCLLLKCF
jgi:NAD(P)-dependent dehydrogenase (short-subunit alcohol dehydrogenase family)